MSLSLFVIGIQTFTECLKRKKRWYKSPQTNSMQLFDSLFCINMAVMICNDSIVSYIIHMDDQPFLMYSLTISFNKKIQKWQFMHYVCGRPTFTDVFSDFASALNVRSRSSRSSSSSKSNCNRRFSHCLPTIILLLTEQKHLYSPSWKPSCIVMCANPFWTAKHTESTIPILTAKNLSFVCQGKREERLTCLWRNVSDVLISSSFACHSHQIFHQYNLRFTQCLNMIRFPIFLRRIPNNFRSRLTRF